MEGLGGDGHIHSFNSISQVPHWTVWEAQSPLLCHFCLGWDVHRTPETEVPAPFFTAFLPRSHHLRVPQPCPYLDTSSLCSPWDRSCRGERLRSLLPVTPARATREERKSS